MDNSKLKFYNHLIAENLVQDDSVSQLCFLSLKFEEKRGFVIAFPGSYEILQTCGFTKLKKTSTKIKKLLTESFVALRMIFKALLMPSTQLQFPPSQVLKEKM